MTKMKTLRMKMNGMISLFLFSFFFISPPSPNPGMILTLHFVFLSKTEISNFKNVSVNVLSSLYIFVAFVLFINLCNTSFNLSALHLVTDVDSVMSSV